MSIFAKKAKLDTWLPYILAIGGAIGTGASFILTVEKIASIKNPAYVATCSINPLFSCTAVAATPQAELFGVPSSLFGVIAFSVITTIGVGLLAGATFKPWFWRLLLLGSVGGAVFIHWLFVQSVYVIGALCLYCMGVWAVTMPIAWYVLLYTFRHNILLVRYSARPLIAFMQRNHALLLAGWYAVIALLITLRFI